MDTLTAERPHGDSSTIRKSSWHGPYTSSPPIASHSTNPWRTARAFFDGKTEFRELTVRAGDELQVVKEEVTDGWSLVSDVQGEMGLLYTALDTNFKLNNPQKFCQKYSFGTYHSRTAEEWVPKGKAADTVITATTYFDEGVWPSHEKTLFSEDEERVDTELVEAEEHISGINTSSADRHFVDTGHARKSKLPSFKVIVQTNFYTFWLPGIALPPLPEKQCVGRNGSVTPAGPSFYAQVFHPAFNLDIEDAKEAVERALRSTRKQLGKAC
ncbi:hypothetical protein BDP27DRAFT_1358822 [Rhodocollybia butyracea]|uniref:SH3 domain-containing protein n=1 Tax=Rhodocollybia butyracea TaxID=206335 RepID=A0A9P5Q6N2_9AGAR|nr:hypothetical protein BDP27DRAFT_1358822 [Rhodocollybia butyracea]